uniref:Uncharacterized protein n=1 Tax=Micrurus spixii TaxID=129469 RepID=A0A2D4LW10_9SAUR
MTYKVPSNSDYLLSVIRRLKASTSGISGRPVFRPPKAAEASLEPPRVKTASNGPKISWEACACTVQIRGRGGLHAHVGPPACIAFWVVARKRVHTSMRAIFGTGAQKS